MKKRTVNREEGCSIMGRRENSYTLEWGGRRAGNRAGSHGGEEIRANGMRPSPITG
jgi:hypothetical protein